MAKGDAFQRRLPKKASRSVARFGYGEMQPVDTNKTESGRKRNRRVEFIIVQ